MRVLVACEYSAIVRDAFRNAGHNAFSCDIIPTDGDPTYHYQCDVLDILNQDWDLMIGHPPCTYLTNAGVRHLHENVTSKNGVRAKVYGKERWAQMELAAQFFNKLKNANITRIALENPVPHGYAKALIGNYTQIIQPWQFGQKQTKKICLWLKNLQPLIPTNIIQPPKIMTQEEKRMWHKTHYTPDTKHRSKIRNRFFEGIAKAMAEQWGTLCTK